MYKQPIVEQTQMMPSSMVMSGSGALQNSGQGTGDILTPPGGDIIGG